MLTSYSVLCGVLRNSNWRLSTLHFQQLEYVGF